METEELARALAGSLEPVRRLAGVERRTLLWSGFALLCVSLGAWALGPRADLASKVRDPAWLRENALLLAVFVLSARSAFQLSVPGAERSAAARMLPLAGLLLWAALLAARLQADPLPAAAGWLCISKMTCLALAPALAALVMLRRAAPLDPGWTGWSALLAAAALAILGTRALCAKDDPRHVFLWHFGPLLVAALAGIHLGRWLLARRVA